MATWSQFFHLIELTPTDPLSTNGYEFQSSDVVVIDAVLYQGATGHHHDGVSSGVENPNTGPGLTQADTGGSLGAGLTIYYEYTYVNPIGLETAPSPSANIATPAQLAAPPAPSVYSVTGTGTNITGAYQYRLTNYLTVNTNETTPGSSATTVLSAEGENVLSWTQTSGSSGVNIYVLQPGGAQYLYLTSVAYGTTTYTDNGGTAANCNRTLPLSNTTYTTNTVTVTLVAPPLGWTINLYRTFTSGQWGSSQIATSITGTTYIDFGNSPVGITPPTTSRIPSDPSKVLLTNGAEVQGELPMTNVAGFPFIVSFSFPGPLIVQNGISVWTCETTSATIVSVRASLGKGHTPASQPVIVDVTKAIATSGNPPTPYTSIFGAVTPTYPEVLVGKQIGVPVTPVVTTLLKGDVLTANILQVGGGATPTDGYLTVDILLYLVP